MFRIVAILFIVAGFPYASLAESSDALEKALAEGERVLNDMIQLGTECGPVGLIVYVHDGDEIQLTEDAVAIAARSRLRSARLYPAPGTQATGNLHVEVLLAEIEFTYRLWFEKPQLDLISDIRSWSPTGWEGWVLGRHGGKASFVLSSIARQLDKFLDDYLRVNDFYCTNSTMRLGPELDHDPLAEE